jgi:hypothetical protein
VALLPVIAASGAIGKKQLDQVQVEPVPPPLGGELTGPAPTTVVAAAPDASPALIAPAPVAEVTSAAAPPLQSGAIGAAYLPLLAFVDAQIERQRVAILPGSVVPEGGVSLTDPKFVACSGNPNAVMIDLDRESGSLIEDGLVADPGLLSALAALRAKPVRIIWISGERQAELGTLRARLEKAGLVPEGEDEILFPVSARSRKQTLRLDAASRHCVLAMAGDKRGDFDELYDFLIDPGSAILLERHFGAGWFMTPAPFQKPAAPTPSEGTTQ